MPNSTAGTTDMPRRRSDGAVTLTFVVGALVALVAVLAYIIFATDYDFTPRDADPARVELSTAPGTADDAQAVGRSTPAAPDASRD